MSNKEFEYVYLSRRNLEALLSKLDRLEAGGESFCSIIKYRNPLATDFVQSMDTCIVQAVPNEEFYAAQERPAGAMLPVDEAKLTPMEDA